MVEYPSHPSACEGGRHRTLFFFFPFPLFYQEGINSAYINIQSNLPELGGWGGIRKSPVSLSQNAIFQLSGLMESFANFSPANLGISSISPTRTHSLPAEVHLHCPQELVQPLSFLKRSRIPFLVDSFTRPLSHVCSKFALP